jgi:hypothetical protein
MYRNYLQIGGAFDYAGGGNPCNAEGTYVDNAMNRRLGRVGEPYVKARGCSSSGNYQIGDRTGNPYSLDYVKHKTGKRATKNISHAKSLKRSKSFILPKKDIKIEWEKPEPLILPKKIIEMERENPDLTEINKDIVKLNTICNKLTDPNQKRITLAEANIFINSLIRKYDLNTARLQSGPSLKAITHNCGDLGDQLFNRKKLIRA